MLALSQEHILEQENGKERCLKYVTELSQAFALAVPHKKALEIRDDVGFFQAVRACLAKFGGGSGARTEDELDSAVKQLVSRAISSDQVIDIFQTAGLDKPDISILSDEFLAEVRGMPHKNLAVELLKKLLNDEIKVRARKNLIQGRSFTEMLERTIKQYQNKAIEAARVIEELIELAKKMREANQRGEKLGLTEDEVAFYDALEVNDSAVKVLGDEALRSIARELVETIRRNRSIDWTLRESIQARLRIMVKRVLRKYGYPPDMEKRATDTVLEQAKMLCKDWPETVGSEKSDLFFSDVIQDGSLAKGYAPIYDLQAVATSFVEQRVPKVLGWKPLDGVFKLNKDMFIAKVVGKSMEPTIKEGSWCLFRPDQGGSRNGKVVLVESRKILDPETNASYTIKRYFSEKAVGEDEDSFRHAKIILKPDNKDFEDIALRDVQAEDFHVVAEFVQVLGTA